MESHYVLDREVTTSSEIYYSWHWSSQALLVGRGSYFEAAHLVDKQSNGGNFLCWYAIYAFIPFTRSMHEKERERENLLCEIPQMLSDTVLFFLPASVLSTCVWEPVFLLHFRQLLYFFGWLVEIQISSGCYQPLKVSFQKVNVYFQAIVKILKLMLLQSPTSWLPQALKSCSGEELK